MLLFIAQMTIFFFAIFDGLEEKFFTVPFRELGEREFPFPARSIASKGAHNWGAVGVVVLCYGLALLLTACNVSFFGFGFWLAVLYFGAVSILLLFVYWLTFDIAFSLAIGKAWYYLGTTAKTDETLNGLHIGNIGIWKAGFCVVSIAALNYFILKSF